MVRYTYADDFTAIPQCSKRFDELRCCHLLLNRHSVCKATPRVLFPHRAFDFRFPHTASRRSVDTAPMSYPSLSVIYRLSLCPGSRDRSTVPSCRRLQATKAAKFTLVAFIPNRTIRPLHIRFAFQSSSLSHAAPLAVVIRRPIPPVAPPRHVGGFHPVSIRRLPA
jgi:hypothetical protein